MGNALITGDYIYDEILVQDHSKVNKSVLTINNNDIDQYFRNSGVNIIYEFMEAMNAHNVHKENQISIDYLPFYEQNKIPKFVTISKWKIKNDNDERKYYIDEFLGSKHDLYDKNIDECKCYSDNVCTCSDTYNVFSIYDRFSSMLAKGEPIKTHSDIIRNEKVLYFLDKSENIILRTKYFKNDNCANISLVFKGIFKNSPFSRISQEKDSELYNKTILLISLREIRDLETYIPVGTSWEELLKNIKNIFSPQNTDYSQLQNIKCVIIAIDDDGLIISYKDDDSERKYALICDPGTIDGYCKNHTVDYNKVSGYMSLLQGYLTYKIAQKEIKINDENNKTKFDDIINFCREGHVGVRHLDKLGFKCVSKNGKKSICIENEKVISHLERYKKYIEKSKTDELSAEKLPEFSEINIYKLDFDNVTSNFHFLDYSIKKNVCMFYKEFDDPSNKILNNIKELGVFLLMKEEELNDLKALEMKITQEEIVKKIQNLGLSEEELMKLGLEILYRSESRLPEIFKKLKDKISKEIEELEDKKLQKSTLQKRIEEKNILGDLQDELKKISCCNQKLAIENGIAIVWAKYIVRYGYKKLYKKLNKSNIFVPYAKFDNLISFDKKEIEQLRDIERSMMDYNRNADLESPLSIAVFGEPGSGKSYTIEEIAKNIFKTKKHIVLTFNISQFDDSDELIESFRLIQNAVLQDIIPIVFWDEFDSMYVQEELGWLKYFLAPMQSGKFLYNQVEYKIGRCIFIFAGGTCATHKEFVNKCKEKGMKKVKAPDFLGRLKATLDIPSLSRPKDRIINDVEEKLYKDSLDFYGRFIENDLNIFMKSDNPEISLDTVIKEYTKYELLHQKNIDKDINENLGNPINDKMIQDNLTERISVVLEKGIPNKYSSFSYIFKRAMVLRQNLLRILSKGQDDELEIEDPILNAFLMVDKYYYDSRSMNAILNLFHIQYKEFTIRTSGIPSAQQLSLHTKAEDFIKYCKNDYDDKLIFIKRIDSDKNICAESIIKIMRWYQEIF